MERVETRGLKRTLLGAGISIYLFSYFLAKTEFRDITPLFFFISFGCFAFIAFRFFDCSNNGYLRPLKVRQWDDSVVPVMLDRSKLKTHACIYKVWFSVSEKEFERIVEDNKTTYSGDTKKKHLAMKWVEYPLPWCGENAQLFDTNKLKNKCVTGIKAKHPSYEIVNILYFSYTGRQVPTYMSRGF
jgi:hypothetical protein